MERSLRLIKLYFTLLHLSHLHRSVLLGTIRGVIMKVVKAKYMDFVGKEALNRSGIQQLNYGASLGNRMVKITLS